MRIILVTGKGGVGKTTVAAATALRCARDGARTLVMSTDPAHSLADSFDVELGDALTPVAPRCEATQLDPAARMESSWGEIREYLQSVFRWAGLDGVEGEELAVLPGLEELFALTDVTAAAEAGRHDVLVVDCAPTAETIRLLSLPDVLSWYMERAFPLGRRVTRVVGPVVTRLTSAPVADDEVFGAVDGVYHQLRAVRDLLRDRRRSSVRLVVNPEKMVVAEARRTYTYLSLFGYAVDAVVVNRLLPDAVADPWFDQWRLTQRRHLDAVEEGFAPLPVLRAELAAAEVVGVERLDELGRALYGEVDPAAVLVEGEPLAIHEDGDDGLRLVLELPFAAREGVEVGRSRDELFVRVGPYRRAILLPDSLRRREVAGARLEGGRLAVRFV